MSFFIASSDHDLEFKCYIDTNEEKTWWPFGVEVNVNSTRVTIGPVCKTFCLWTCNLDLVCFEKKVFVYCKRSSAFSM